MPSEKCSHTAGAILSGGLNTRMGGRCKAFIEIDGTALVEKTVNAFKEIFTEIIIITNSPRDYQKYQKDCHIIGDKIKDIGPLGGIHSALSYTSKKAVFFIACDMPFTHNGLIQCQLSLFNKIQCQALLPKIDTSIEPLYGIYKKELKDSIYTFVKTQRDYSIKSFLKSINPRYIELKNNTFTKNIFRNLNTPEDLNSITHDNKSKSKSMAG